MNLKFVELTTEIAEAKKEVTRLIGVAEDLHEENDSVKGELATAVDTIEAKNVTIIQKDARIASLEAQLAEAGTDPEDVSDAEFDVAIAQVKGIKQGASEAATLNDPAN